LDLLDSYPVNRMIFLSRLPEVKRFGYGPSSTIEDGRREAISHAANCAIDPSLAPVERLDPDVWAERVEAKGGAK